MAGKIDACDITTKNGNIRVLRKAKAATIEDAVLLVEGIRKTGMCRNSGPGAIPRSTLRWLSKLSALSKTRIRIITNATADYLFCQSNMWRNFERLEAVLTSTWLAYPAKGQEMPAILEYHSYLDHSQKLIRRMDTRQYKGMKGMALVFERAKIAREYINGEIIEKIFPRGEIGILDCFPQRSGDYGIPAGGQMLGAIGDSRHILRKSIPWIGNIVRASSLGGIRNPHTSIFACFEPADPFALLIELPPIKPGKKEPEQIAMDFPAKEGFHGPLPKEEQIKNKPGELGSELRAELRERIGKRVTLYYLDPGQLHVGTPAILEVGERLANIAQGNGPLANSLREYVRETAGWVFLQLGDRQSIEQFYYTFAKICDALGIPIPNDIRKIGSLS